MFVQAEVNPWAEGVPMSDTNVLKERTFEEQRIDLEKNIIPFLRARFYRLGMIAGSDGWEKREQFLEEIFKLSTE